MYQLGSMTALNIHKRRNGSCFESKKLFSLFILFLPCNPSCKAIDAKCSLKCRIDWPVFGFIADGLYRF